MIKFLFFLFIFWDICSILTQFCIVRPKFNRFFRWLCNKVSDNHWKRSKIGVKGKIGAEIVSLIDCVLNFYDYSQMFYDNVKISLTWNQNRINLIPHDFCFQSNSKVIFVWHLSNIPSKFTSSTNPEFMKVISPNFSKDIYRSWGATNVNQSD